MGGRLRIQAYKVFLFNFFGLILIFFYLHENKYLSNGGGPRLILMAAKLLYVFFYF